MRSHHKCLSKAVWGLSVDFLVYLPTFACLFFLRFGISYIFDARQRAGPNLQHPAVCVCASGAGGGGANISDSVA